MRILARLPSPGWIVALLLLWSPPAHADGKLESRARALELQIRCVVCQSQSIADSDAELAHDMRQLIRDRLAAGDDEAMILAFLRARYGDAILLRPPLDPRTLALWFGPPLVAVGALAVLLLRRRGRTEAPLSEAEQAALAALKREESA